MFLAFSLEKSLSRFRTHCLCNCRSQFVTAELVLLIANPNEVSHQLEERQLKTVLNFSAFDYGQEKTMRVN